MASAQKVSRCPWLPELHVAWYGSSHRDAGQYGRRTLRSYIARSSTGAHVANILLEEAAGVLLP